YCHGMLSSTRLMNPRVSVGLIYLSGDDPKTTGYEGWDPLYSRSTRWSKLYPKTLLNEGGAAYWSNIIAPSVVFSLDPADKIVLEATVYFLFAQEGAPGHWVGAAGRSFCLVHIRSLWCREGQGPSVDYQAEVVVLETLFGPSSLGAFRAGRLLRTRQQDGSFPSLGDPVRF
ncbi:MAG: hypothetical protein KAX38_09830, partial [Candidatus Krumholzibacteria bacterium]|nr:hypothetical protein [Candidatus Krumholzibacteria bacterium]